MTDNNLILWGSETGEEIATRVAIAGDFLPAGQLSFPPGGSWREMASNVAEYFDDVTTAFANLECPVGDKSLLSRPPHGLGQIVFSRENSLEYLQAIRARAVGIANNHSYDFYDQGVEQTRKAVAANGMIPLGAGRTIKDAPEVLVLPGPRNLRVGFWAAAKATHDAASHDHAGVEPATCARAISACKEMERQGATFFVALLHAGCLRTNRPDPEDVRLMGSLAQSGFHLVAASHSHRISGYRQVNSSHKSPAFCFYGLGTLVSGYVSSPLEREGLVVVAGFNRDGKFVRLEIRPVLLDENGFGRVPVVCERDKIFQRFRDLSNEISDGSYKEKFFQDVSRGLLQLYLRDAQAAFQLRGIRGLATKMGRVRLRHVRRLVHKVTG
jgi:poly-gamma-glutamate capsule biosynthesis protein CapA/YwtB (metallophosphatase superfamily)